MGILGLAKMLADLAPSAIKETDIKSYFGRKIAIDASMCLYQFLIAVRSEGAQLTSLSGETTSHLMGTFYRTIRLMENGIKPLYVFDGKPPDLKSAELTKRAERREDAQKELDKAIEAGDSAMMDKFNRRLVKVTQHHAQEVKELLTLMGVPYLDAPCEAEAQCAALVASGKVYAAATEDMDALTFGSKVLLRHMTFSEARKLPIQEFHLERILQQLSFTREEFIDLCILLGCDYCPSIRGIGPKRAIELMTQYRSIENVLKNIDSSKYTTPENWNYQQARKLFTDPDVSKDDHQFKWNEPDEEGLVKFLCGERQFNEDRVRSGAKKLMKTRTGSTQGRLDTFFMVTPIAGTPKRKADDKKKPVSSAKKPKVASKSKGRAK